MSTSTRTPAGRLLFFALAVALLIFFPSPDSARAQAGLAAGAAAALGGAPAEEGSPESREDKQGISFPADEMEEGLWEAAAEVGEQARSLL